MLKKLFQRKPRLDSDDAAERLAALQQEDARPPTDHLKRLAREDPSAEVRTAALASLHDPADLAELLDAAPVAGAAAERLAGTPDLPASIGHHPLVLGARLTHFESQEQAHGLLTGLPTHELLCSALLACHESRRSELLSIVTARGEDALVCLEKQSRGRCKPSNRYARDQLAVLRGLRTDRGVALTRAAEIAAALTRDSDTPGRRQTLTREGEKLLATLEAQSAAMRDLGEPAEAAELAPLRTALAQSAARAEAAAAEAAAAQAAAASAAAARAVEAETTSIAADQGAVATLDGEPATGAVAVFDESAAAAITALEALSAALEALLTGNPDPGSIASGRAAAEAARAALTVEPPPPLAGALERVIVRARELEDAHVRLEALQLPAFTAAIDPWPSEPPALRAIWQAASTARRHLKDARRHLAALRWPLWASPPDAIARHADALDALAGQLEAVGAHAKHLDDELGAAVEQTERHVDAGKLAAARSAFGYARRLDRSLAHHGHQSALARAGARLGELDDWSKFATTPKREALIETLQGLVAQPRAPADQAAAIKQARAEWRALGAPGYAERSLESRFNALAEAAFEPCRAYFQEQAELRARNLAARVAICEQLEQYLQSVDWTGPDLRAAEQILYRARDEWRDYDPVERDAGRILQSRFDDLQATLAGHVKAVRAGNRTAKERIIDTARALADGLEPAADKADQVKRLQHEWQTIGPTPRKLDQQLWSAFRAECDRIFGERDATANAHRAAEAAAATEAEALVGAFEASLAEDAADQAAFTRLRAALSALGAMPRDREQALRGRMAALADAVRDLGKTRARAARRSRIQALREADLLMTAAEATGTPIELPEPLFAGRGPAALANLDDTLLRRLAIRAEILAGRESPTADQGLRLEIQVDLLNRSLNEGTRREDPLALAEEWCRTGGPPSAREALRERLFQALASTSGD